MLSAGYLGQAGLGLSQGINLGLWEDLPFEGKFCPQDGRAGEGGTLKGPVG